MIGRVTDSRNLPVVGAVITARGATVGWTATLNDGTYRLSVPAGAYEILFRKGGFTPSATTVVLDSGSVRSVSVVLAEANLTSVDLAGGSTGAAVAFNASASATATLPNAALAERPNVWARDLALELPGVTLAHPARNVPDTSFVVRGGTDETRVQIDGHAVSAGATGRWNSSLASLALYDSIELVKGVGVSGANAGESAFGTLNLRTRDFTRERQVDVATGIDGFGGKYSAFGTSGNALNDRLSYVFEHNVYGYNGPQAGHSVYNVATKSSSTALLAERQSLDSPLSLGSDLAKLRWRFSGSTSLTFGYIGTHSEYFATGGAYGVFDGTQQILPSAEGSGGLTDYSSPYYRELIGKQIPGYTFATNSVQQTNQPLFEAELRTAIGNDTLLVRPYVATIFNLLDGSNRSSGVDPSDGGAFKLLTSGPGCSVQAPCEVPDTGLAYRDQELDRLHGTTVTLIHPLGDASLNLSYDYRSDETTVTSGNPSVQFDGTLPSVTAYEPVIPTTLARNADWSAVYTLALNRRVGLSIGDYYTDWQLRFGSLIDRYDITHNTASQQLVHSSRSHHHDDPHVGLTWRPRTDVAVRFTGGSSISVPYAELMAGGQIGTNLFSGYGVLAQRNPDLLPESTVAYDLGVDRRFANGAVVTIDAFDNTIHNVFANQVTPFDGAILGIPAGNPIGTVFATVVKPINAPLERNYGIDFSLARSPVTGIGFRLSGIVQRAFFDLLPTSFSLAPSSLVTGKQLDGSTSIPYTHAYAEVNYHGRSGLGAMLSADYTGTNNWTNGPAFSVWSTMLRYDFGRRYRAQMTVENLFNADSGTQIVAGVANGGYGIVDYGARNGSVRPTFGTAPATRFAISPRTFRFQIEAHLGR